MLNRWGYVVLSSLVLLSGCRPKITSAPVDPEKLKNFKDELRAKAQRAMEKKDGAASGGDQPAAAAVQPEGEGKIPAGMKPENKVQGKERIDDPFLTFEEEDLFKDQSKAIPITEGMELSAVFYAPPHSSAIINGKIIKEGDIIDNKEVMAINPEDISLKDTQSQYILKLRNILGQGQ